jgi:ubiquinone biosynthesis protein
VSPAPFAGALRDLNRLRQISLVVARHGFGEFLVRSRVADILGRRPEPPDPATQGKATAARFREMLAELGPTFVKLGQVLSSRPDLLPAAWIDELQLLQDRVPAVPVAAVRGRIEEELGRPVAELFAQLSEEPLASASIAQVHEARTLSGERVAVKVQRPGIEATIRADLDLLRYLARVLEAVVEETGVYGPTGIVEEFERSLAEELDFLNEARNVETFAHANRDHPALLVPTVFPELTSERVLTLSFVEGVKITDACPPHDGPALARTLVESAFHQLFEDGVFHGDPHPGNLMVLEDGRIGMLDFGLVGRLTPQMRENVVMLVIAVALRDADSVARLIYRVGIPDQKTSLADFRSEIDAILQRYLGASLKDIESRTLLRDLLDLAVRYRIKVPKEYALLGKSAMTLEGILRKLDPDLDVLALGMPYARRLLQDRWDPGSLLDAAGGLRSMLRLQTLVKDVPAQLNQILLDVEGGKFTVNARVPDLPALERAVRGLGISLVLGVTAAGFVVGGFVALSQLSFSAGAVPGALLLGAIGALAGGFFFWSAMSWSAMQGRLRKIRLSRWLPRK